MGFIIHKYFLSKSLKAPPTSESKKKKSTASRRYSQPAIGSRGVAQPSAMDFLSVPENAYANTGISYNPSLAARRRRNSMATLRRASIAEGTMEDSMNSFEGSPSSPKKQSPHYRRMSLQNDYSSQQQQQQQDDTRYSYPLDDFQNSFSSYYQLEDAKEDTPYGAADWDEAKRRPQRRYSTSSVSSSNMMETTHSRDSSTSTTNLIPSGRVRQENKWLQLQLKQYQRHCSQLEAKLYGARDQLAYTNASWLDQLYDAQHKHQQEVFQTQRQAEQASNAILEQEMDDLKEALLRVAQEEAKLEEKKKEFGQHGEYDVKQLHSELKEWKERHAQATANAKRIQDILELEAKESNERLEESERRVQWLEEQLQAVIPEDDDDEYSPPINPQLVIILQKQLSQLENRVQDLLMENTHLQREQSETYELQTQVKELESALKESREQHTMHQTWHARQIEYWKHETSKWKDQVQVIEKKLDQKVASRETIRAEYASRIELLETENVRLKNQLENRQKEWRHQSNLKDRTIEGLQSQVARLGGTWAPATPPVTSEEGRLDGAAVEKKQSLLETNKRVDITSITEDTVFDDVASISSLPDDAVSKRHPITASIHNTTISEDETSELHRAQRREKELLLQISRLEESEANAQRQVQRANDHIQTLQSILQEQNALGDSQIVKDVHMEQQEALAAADDASIDQLLDAL